MKTEPTTVSKRALAGGVELQTKAIRITVKFEDLSLLGEGFCHFLALGHMAPNSCFKILGN